MLVLLNPHSIRKRETDILITSKETATRATVILRLRSNSEQWSAWAWLLSWQVRKQNKYKISSFYSKIYRQFHKKPGKEPGQNLNFCIPRAQGHSCSPGAGGWLWCLEGEVWLWESAVQFDAKTHTASMFPRTCFQAIVLVCYFSGEDGLRVEQWKHDFFFSPPFFLILILKVFSQLWDIFSQQI